VLHIREGQIALIPDLLYLYLQFLITYSVQNGGRSTVSDQKLGCRRHGNKARDTVGETLVTHHYKVMR